MKYNTKNAKETLYITKEEILAKVTEEEIFRHYLGDIAIKKMITSPLRKDPIPSFNLYYRANGELVYKDFGGSQGTFIDFVMNLYNLNYSEALTQVFKDLQLSQRKQVKKQESKVISNTTKIQVVTRKFTEEDLQYWNNYGISERTLRAYMVVSCQSVWLNDRMYLSNSTNNLCYGYYFPKSGKIKIYRPYAEKKYKWLGNCDRFDIQGYDQLAESGKLLIITKALKDVMLFRELGFEAIAPQGEGINIPESIQEELWKRFDKIITVYDNDDPGVLASIKLNKALGSDYWNIPRTYKEKDITDFRKVHGKEKTQELLKELYEYNI